MHLFKNVRLVNVDTFVCRVASGFQSIDSMTKTTAGPDLNKPLDGRAQSEVAQSGRSLKNDDHGRSGL